jgi:hypothetical protein
MMACTKPDDESSAYGRRLLALARQIVAVVEPNDQEDCMGAVIHFALQKAGPEKSDAYIRRCMQTARWKQWRAANCAKRRAETVPIEELSSDDLRNLAETVPSQTENAFAHPAAREYIFHKATPEYVVMLHLWALAMLSGQGRNAYAQAAHQASLTLSSIEDFMQRQRRGEAVPQTWQITTENTPLIFIVKPYHVRYAVERFMVHMRPYGPEFGFYPSPSA